MMQQKTYTKMKLFSLSRFSRRRPARTVGVRIVLLALSGTLALSGCTSADSFSRTTTGLYLGSWFGSAVGGIIGGRRGADLGTVIGGATGAALGAASSEAARKEREEERRARIEARRAQEPRYGDFGGGDVTFEQYKPMTPGATSPRNIEVANVVFADADGDRILRPGERAEITFDIYNRGTTVLRNVAPIVAADYDRVNVSPTAIISEILPGQGYRYRAAVLARRNAKSAQVNFTVSFLDAMGQQVPARSFTVSVVK